MTVALPHMQGAFSATTDQIAWVMIAFIIGSAMMTTSVGWFSGRFGRRRVYLCTVAGYTVTLIGCAASTSLEQEVLWRFAQGFCGAALIPLGQLIAVNAFPKERYSQATSLWAMGFVVAGVLAPAVAGFIIEDLSWPWIFHINVPVAIGVFAAAWFLVPDSPRKTKPMDWMGYLSLIICVGVLQLMLARGERLDWFSSPEIVIEALISAIAFYVFLAHTFTAKEPFVDKVLFHDRNFGLGLVFIFLIGTVLFLPLLLLPLQLQQVGGYAPIDTGYLLLPRGVGTLIGLVVMAQIRDRFDPRPILCVGLTLTATFSLERLLLDHRHPADGCGPDELSPWPGDRSGVGAAQYDHPVAPRPTRSGSGICAVLSQFRCRQRHGHRRHCRPACALCADQPCGHERSGLAVQRDAAVPARDRCLGHLPELRPERTGYGDYPSGLDDRL